MGLAKYQSMRRFSKTPEPKGKVKHASSKKLEFVIHKHAATRLHYDFRLELDGVLKSWAVPKGPSMNPKDRRLAVAVEDHPYDYRKFEGIIPEGNYGAGEVIIWDKGTYTDINNSDDPVEPLREGLKKGDLKFEMHGEKLKGKFALVKSSHDDKNWFLIKKKDEFASNEDIAKKDKSVVSGKHVEDLREKEVDLSKLPEQKPPDL
jgi:bifunctional non-homologous end joining protein LigD